VTVAEAPLIAIVAAGEMGSAIGARLRSRGARVITSLTGRSAASARRARDAGIEVVETYVELMRAELFLSIVPPGRARELAEQLAPALAGASNKPVFVDCNAVSVRTVASIAATIERAGAPFVDAGIIGGPPSERGTDGACIYASGAHARALAPLAAYGMRVRYLDGPIGQASALKMSYAAITKGLIAIGSVAALGATRAGVVDALRTELRESQPAIAPWLDRQLPTIARKAYRWIAEMHEIAEFLESPASGETIYRGAAQFYAHLAATNEDGNGGEAAEAIVQLDRFVQTQHA